MTMAIRYGSARSMCGRSDLWDFDLTDRARGRRFAALSRLVYALKRQSS